MSEFDVNFKDSTEQEGFSNFTESPDGWHNVTIEDAVFKTAQNDSSKKFINFKFKIDDAGEHFFFTAFINGLDTNNALFTVIKACGTEADRIRTLDKMDTQFFVGKQLQADVRRSKTPVVKDGKSYYNLALVGLDRSGASHFDEDEGPTPQPSQEELV
jgi:hypothetical protein